MSFNKSLKTYFKEAHGSGMQVNDVQLASYKLESTSEVVYPVDLFILVALGCMDNERMAMSLELGFTCTSIRSSHLMSSS